MVSHKVDKEEPTRLAFENFGNLLSCAESTSQAVSDHKCRIQAKNDRLLDKKSPDHVGGAMEILVDIVEKESKGEYDRKDYS